MSRSYIDPRFWDEVQGLSVPAQFLWSVLITHPYGQLVPGLLRFGILGLAEAHEVSPHVISDALAELQSVGLVEHDEHARLFRMPSAPRWYPKPGRDNIKGWWRHWQTFPECALKYAHVQSLGEVCDLNTKTPASDAWAQTFGTLTIVADESGATKVLSITPNNDLPLFARTLEPPPDPPSGGADPERERERMCVLVPEVFSGSGCPDPSLGRADEVHGHGSNGFHSYLDALSASSAGQVAITPYDQRLDSALSSMFGRLREQGVTTDDMCLAGEWIHSGGMTYQLDIAWLLKPGNLVGVIGKAQSWNSNGRPAIGGKKKSANYHVTGKEKHTTGDVKL